MENRYMKAQCKNMISVIAAFSQACELAALEDDGIRSKTEERELRKIRAAAERFRGELARVMKQPLCPRNERKEKQCVLTFKIWPT